MRPLPALYDASPAASASSIEGTDLLVVRELTGGLYFGERGPTDDRAYDTCVYTVAEIERIARAALPGRAVARHERRQGQRARDVSRLWREVVTPRPRRGVPPRRARAPARRRRGDAAVAAPRHFDVIVTENMFGDILSDEAAMLTGSLGMLPERVARAATGRACSSPSTARRPTSPARGSPTRWRCSCSAALLLRHGLGREDEAAAVESAVDRALAEGLRTRRPGRRRDHRRGHRRRCCTPLKGA